MEIDCTEIESPGKGILRIQVVTDEPTTVDDLLEHSPVLELLAGREHKFNNDQEFPETRWLLDIHTNGN